MVAAKGTRKLAVLIPTYNGAACISDALKSLLAYGATSSNIEAVYIADDASTDDTIGVARSVWQSDVPLIIIPGARNLGEGGNLNRSMTLLGDSGFEWVMLLHQDDLLIDAWVPFIAANIHKFPERVGLVSCHNDYQVGLHQNDTHEIGERGSAVPVTVETRLHAEGEQSVRNLRRRWFWSVSGTVIRVPGYKIIGGFHPALPYAADNDFLCRVFLGGYQVLEYYWTCVLKRNHSASQTSRTDRNGRDVVGWCYIMHRYLQYSSKFYRTLEYFTKLYGISRRAMRFLRWREWMSAIVQIRSISTLTQSYIALLLNMRWLIPASVEQLLNYHFSHLSS